MKTQSTDSNTPNCVSHWSSYNEFIRGIYKLQFIIINVDDFRTESKIRPMTKNEFRWWTITTRLYNLWYNILSTGRTSIM